MIRFQNDTLSQYLDKLAARDPTPGGGSAGAVSAALGAGLIQMVAKYSLNKGKPKRIETRLANIDKQAGIFKKDFLALVSLDAEAYLAVVASWKKDKKAQNKANKEAVAVVRKLKSLSQKALKMLPFLSKEGNKYLISDVDAAEVLLNAAIKTSDIMIKANS